MTTMLNIGTSVSAVRDKETKNTFRYTGEDDGVSISVYVAKSDVADWGNPASLTVIVTADQ